MTEVTDILSDIDKGNIKPIYFLMGEEPYYIDLISDHIEQHLLSEADKGFNQVVLYGRDVSVEAVVDHAKRFPMMADRQVVIVKEAQVLSRTIDKLVAYAKQPQPSTVLVICYKYKKLDKRKALYKSLQQAGLVYESKKLYENQVADWIRRLVNSRKYSIDSKAALMLVEFLGNDLSRIRNELDKLMLDLGESATITPEAIETHIGISKEYNNFELRKAVAERNVLKAHRISAYFARNQRLNPLVVTLSLLHSFFTQLLIYHSLKDKSKNNVAKALGVHPFFVSDYAVAAKNYPMRRVSRVVSLLRTADLKSKGVGANALAEGQILKELLCKILYG